MRRLIPQDNDLGWTPYAWLVYALPFVLTPLYDDRHGDAAGWALHLGTLAVFLPLYFRSYWAQGRELMLIAGATVMLGIALWPVSHGAGAFFIYGASMIGTLEPGRRAMQGVAFIAVVASLEALLLRRNLFSSVWPPLFVVIVGGISMHFSQVGRTNARLRLARDEVEHLAKVAERERIARDLHDVLGHTLSLVILKSELASKLADRQPERARDEIRDVERIAREALAQVRSAVAGYRSGGLEEEIALARGTLATAGVTLDLPRAPRPQLPPSHEAVLCLVIRESVTNIVRHASARNCALELGVDGRACTLRIADDGRGGDAPFGSGLTGMRERVEALGGTLQRDGKRGTTLRVSLPLAPSVTERSA